MKLSRFEDLKMNIADKVNVVHGKELSVAFVFMKNRLAWLT